jgi:hypothetical protein
VRPGQLWVSRRVALSGATRRGHPPVRPAQRLHQGSSKAL